MNNLTGRFLIATPSMDDSRFSRSVAYICEHTDKNAMAIIINQPLPMSLSRIVEGMNIEINNPHLNDMLVAYGGPVQPTMGCVLHRKTSTVWRSTFEVDDICVTTSKDILEACATKTGPEFAMLVLGYSLWSAEQLERELEENIWLTSKADSHIMFDLPVQQRWHAALALLGINVLRLSSRVGHA